jgi:hypothetical protein
MERRYQRDNSKQVDLLNGADVAAVAADPVAPPAGMADITGWKTGSDDWPEAFVVGLRAKNGNNNLTSGLLLGWDPKGGIDQAGALVVLDKLDDGAQIDLKTTRGREFLFRLVAGITHIQVVGTLSAQNLDSWAVPLYRVGG